MSTLSRSSARRVLFATHFCYLDDSNGAAIASRAMMELLARSGFIVEALSGTVLGGLLEVDPAAWLTGNGLKFHRSGGTSSLISTQATFTQLPVHFLLNVRGVPVTLHQSPTSRSHYAPDFEIAEFLRLYSTVLDRFQPDILVNYGGDLLAHEIRARARDRGIAVVFPLHNFCYTNDRPFATTDAVIVPSHHAATHYRQSLHLRCQVLPNLIDFARVRVESRTSEYLTFVTPSPEKGVYAFARIADELGKRRPDIPILVVEGRSTERTLVDCGIDLRVHGNVFLMGTTADPRAFWSVTKICLMPSLWWENQPLVAIEAMVNGIPTIGSDRGGLPETLGGSGMTLSLPAELTPESRTLASVAAVSPWVEAIIALWDDPLGYRDLSERALHEIQRWHPQKLEPLYLDFFNQIASRK